MNEHSHMSARGPEPKITDDQLMRVFDSEEKPFVVTSDIAERVDLSGTRIRQRLDRLVEEGVLEKRKVGRAQIYWREGLRSK